MLALPLTSAAMRVRRSRAIYARALRVRRTSERSLPLATSDVLAQRTQQQAGGMGSAPVHPQMGLCWGFLAHGGLPGPYTLSRWLAKKS